MPRCLAAAAAERELWMQRRTLVGCRSLQDELTKARKALAAEAEQKRILVSLSDRRRRGSTVRCMVNCVWVYVRVRCMCIAHCVTLIALMSMCHTLRRIDASPVVHRVHSSARSIQPCVFVVG